MRNLFLRLNSSLTLAAKTHVGKSKIGRQTKPWPTPELRAAIKLRNNLRSMGMENRTDVIEPSTEVRGGGAVYKVGRFFSLKSSIMLPLHTPAHYTMEIYLKRFGTGFLWIFEKKKCVGFQRAWVNKGTVLSLAALETCHQLGRSSHAHFLSM